MARAKWVAAATATAIVAAVLTSAAPAGATEPGNGDPKMVYQEPQVPMTIDGVADPASKIHDFEGRQLFYVAQDRDNDGQVDAVDIFTTRQGFDREVHADLAQDSSADSVAPLGPTQVSAQWENSYWQGRGFTMRPGYHYTNLATLICGLFPFCTWNDRISSVSSDTSWGTCLYQNANFSGLVLFVKPETSVHDMSLLGWDNMVTSIWVPPYFPTKTCVP